MLQHTITDKIKIPMKASKNTTKSPALEDESPNPRKGVRKRKADKLFNELVNYDLFAGGIFFFSVFFFSWVLPRT